MKHVLNMIIISDSRTLYYLLEILKQMYVIYISKINIYTHKEWNTELISFKDIATFKNLNVHDQNTLTLLMVK